MQLFPVIFPVYGEFLITPPPASATARDNLLYLWPRSSIAIPASERICTTKNRVRNASTRNCTGSRSQLNNLFVLAIKNHLRCEYRSPSLTNVPHRKCGK